MNHEHIANEETKGHWCEVCQCGATRLLDRKNNEYELWHVCNLCRVHIVLLGNKSSGGVRDNRADSKRAIS